MPRKPGAKITVIYQGKILMVLRDNNPAIPFPNVWNMPGGGVEEGETPEEAIKRELKEEVNVVPVSIEVMEATIYPDQSIVFRFFTSLTDEEFEHVFLVSEGQRLDWFTFDEAVNLDLSPNGREYFQRHENEIRKLLERSCPSL